MRKILVAALTAVVTMSVPAVASATSVISTNDLVQTESLQQLTQSVTGSQSSLQQQYCSFAAPKARTLSTSVALQHAGTYLNKHSSAAARRAFANSRFAKTEQHAIAASANALAAA